VAVDPTDPELVWVAAWHNSRINLLDPASNTMTWFAGTGGRFYGEADVDGDGTALDDCVLDLPSSIAFGDDGTLYFSDQANHVIRRITPDGTIETLAGEPRTPGFDGDGGPALEAHLHGHTDQKADPGSKLTVAGSDLYLADTVNGVIRRIDLDSGTIETVAGRYESAGTATYTDAITGASYEADAGSVTGYSGDGGDALDARMNTPRDVAVGPDGELYVADTKNACVRVIRDGIIDTFAGTCGEQGFAGDEGLATDALFGEVFGVAVDHEGHVYVADTSNQVIRRVAR
jgi:sugar lactone lactonase YvrE